MSVARKAEREQDAGNDREDEGQYAIVVQLAQLNDLTWEDRSDWTTMSGR